MTAYYNEFDPKASAWLRQLILNGNIAPGIVDERSITEVTADDLRGFTQHHFFAGIGGWSYALRLAGWSDDRPVCTASLPCQPFSVAGQQKGKSDERHLLPHFVELVKQCNFQTIFGEQVPGAIKHGWLDDLCTEMERENYAVGSIVIPAAAYGAFHIRQRLYWVAEKRVVSYNIETVQHKEKDNDLKEMQQVRGREAGNGIQEQSTGKRQTDVFLHRMWEEKDAGISQAEQGISQLKSTGEAQGKSDTGSKIQSESPRTIPLASADTSYKKKVVSNRKGFQFRSACGRYKEKSIAYDMRTNRNTTHRWKTRKACLQHFIIRQNRLSERIYLRQYKDSVLGNKCSNGAVGRRCFARNNKVVDRKGKNVNDTTSKINRRSFKEFGLKKFSYLQLKGSYKKDSKRTRCCLCIGAGAPHIRQRLYWVADSDDKGSQRRVSRRKDSEREAINRLAGCNGTVGGMANPKNTNWGRDSKQEIYGGRGEENRGSGVWTNTDWIYCRDEKYRPIKHGIEPCTFKVADGLSSGVVSSGDTGSKTPEIDFENTQEARVMRLKGYGNTIVPQVAASFISAFMNI